jgi:hypothetical protein
LPRDETERRLAAARRARPDLFSGPLYLAEASDLGPFGAEIAREFGIAAQCRFGLFVHDKSRLDRLGPAADLLLELFGSGRLVITHGMDTIYRPQG